MTMAIIGTGGIGSAIARLLAAGGEALRLSSADLASARTLAADIGPGASVVAGNGDTLEGADAVVLALRFTVLQDVIGEVAGLLGEKLVVVPSNPLRTDDQGNLVRVLPDGEASGQAVAGWLPPGTRLAMAFGSMSADLLQSSSRRSSERAVLFYASDDARAGAEAERLIGKAGFVPLRVGGLDQSGRLEVGGDLHDRVVSPAEAQPLIGGA